MDFAAEGASVEVGWVEPNNSHCLASCFTISLGLSLSFKIASKKLAQVQQRAENARHFEMVQLGEHLATN